jgi:hypothetical protein
MVDHHTVTNPWEPRVEVLRQTRALSRNCNHNCNRRNVLPTGGVYYRPEECVSPPPPSQPSAQCSPRLLRGISQHAVVRSLWLSAYITPWPVLFSLQPWSVLSGCTNSRLTFIGINLVLEAEMRYFHYMGQQQSHNWLFIGKHLWKQSSLLGSSYKVRFRHKAISVVRVKVRFDDRFYDFVAVLARKTMQSCLRYMSHPNKCQPALKPTVCDEFQWMTPLPILLNMFMFFTSTVA